MRRLLFGAMALLLVGPALGFGIVYLLSESQLRDVAVGADFSHPIDSSAAALARGQHIARTRGCFGCHGQQLEGRVFTDEWDWVDRAVAPNLAAYAQQHDPAVLERAVRQGVGHDGKALWSMPSYNWVHLSDQDTADLIAFLRSAPSIKKSLPEGQLGWQARWLLANGDEEHMAAWASKVPPLLLGPDDDAALVRGEYLAMTTCNECHGFDLRGANVESDIATPDLALVTAYSWDQFNRLLDEGLPKDDRPSLGLMTVVARDRFAYFTPQERTELYAFLRSLPSRPVPQNVFWRTTRSEP